MEAKEEDMVLDIGLPKEEKPPGSNLVGRIKNDITIHSDFKAENEMKIKQEDLVLDFRLQNIDSFCSSDRMKISSDIYGMVPKIEIKEEAWWLEQKSLEVKCQQKALPISELEMYNEIKDETNEDLPAAESARLYTETASSYCGTTTYLFTAADLEEKESFKHGKKNPLIAGINKHEDYEDYIREAPSIQQTVHCQKSTTAHEHKQSEKLDKCSNSSINIPVCEIPRKKSSLQKSLKTRILHHESRRPYTRKNILIHEAKRLYKCDVCERTFTRMRHLKDHILIHEGKRPYKCEVCQKSFTQQGSLRRHILIHEAKRPYKCDICEKSFTQQGSLKSHILIHEGRRPYKCEVCEKSFTHSGTLKDHILIHEGKRPYICAVCEKSFTMKRHLRSHIRVHEGKKPYKCNVCEKSFTQQRSLNRHILIHDL